MPVVTCPGCGRGIDLPPEEIRLLSVTCARCETVFDPVHHLAPVAPVDVDASVRRGIVEAYKEMTPWTARETERMQRRLQGDWWSCILVMLLLPCLLAVGVGILVFILMLAGVH